MNKLYFLALNSFNLDDSDKSELMWSIVDNNMELFEALLEAETEFNHFTTKKGRTALHYAVYYNRYEMCKLLQGKDYSYTYNDHDHISPAILAARFGYLRIIKLFDGIGQEDCIDANRTSSMSYASAYRQNEVLRLLLTCSIPQIQDNFQYNVAHYAAIVGNSEAIKIISKYRQYGADGFEEQDSNGRSPFMLAVVNGNIEVINTMLDIGWKDTFQYSNYDHHKGDLILDNNDMCALQLAAMVGNYNLIDALINKGNFDINRKNKDGKTALLIAAENGQVETLNYIISKTSALDVDNQGNNALMLAVLNSNIFMVKHLIKDVKIDINARNKKHQTALSISTMYHYDEITKFLLDNGGKI